MNGTCKERVLYTLLFIPFCLHVQALVCCVGSEVAVHLVLDPVWVLVVQTVVCATVIKFAIGLEIAVLMFLR